MSWLPPERVARAGGPEDLDNGLLLCALHDRAFDRGRLGLHPDLCLELSPALRGDRPSPPPYASSTARR